MNGDDHGSHVSCGSGSGASPFLTGLVTCFATHDGIPARSTSTVIRLDAATECRCPGCLAPPPERFTAALLEKALRAAVAAVQMPCPPLEDGPERYARWGEQFDVRNITRANGDTWELSAEQVAGYIAKYATKTTESFGSGLDRRLGADDLDHLDRLPAHVAELVRAACTLGSRPELEGLRLRAWAHMLGFPGHWSTRSRRYSTTMTVLRRVRVAFAKRRRGRDGVLLGAKLAFSVSLASRACVPDCPSRL